MPRRAASFSVSVPGLAWKVGALSVVAPKAVDRGMERGIRAATLDIEGHAKELLEGEVLNKRTGRLWRSIHSETFRRMGRVVGIVGTNVKYAAIHEFGGTIRPKSAGGFLVWRGASTRGANGRFQAGEMIFAKEVKIPRRPYLSRAFAARKEVVSRLIMRAVMAELRGRGGLNTGAVVPASERAGVGFNAD
jgi:phage gpG-like protein